MHRKKKEADRQMQTDKKVYSNIFELTDIMNKKGNQKGVHTKFLPMSSQLTCPFLCAVDMQTNQLVKVCTGMLHFDLPCLGVTLHFPPSPGLLIPITVCQSLSSSSRPFLPL